MSFFFPEDYIINWTGASPDIRISCFLDSWKNSNICLSSVWTAKNLSFSQLAWQLNQKRWKIRYLRVKLKLNNKSIFENWKGWRMNVNKREFQIQLSNIGMSSGPEGPPCVVWHWSVSVIGSLISFIYKQSGWVSLDNILHTTHSLLLHFLFLAPCDCDGPQWSDHSVLSPRHRVPCVHVRKR